MTMDTKQKNELKAAVSFDEVKATLLADDELKNEYDKLGPRYEIISQLIAARIDQGITQADLAERIGTKKSNISRFESGNYNPSLDFLIKISHALNKKLTLQLQ